MRRLAILAVLLALPVALLGRDDPIIIWPDFPVGETLSHWGDVLYGSFRAAWDLLDFIRP
jgi:hypothetical protein